MQRLQVMGIRFAESLIMFVAWCVMVTIMITAVVFPLWLTGLL